MEVENIVEKKQKKDSILKKLERYVKRSKSSSSSSRSSKRSIFTKSRSWHSSQAKEKRKSGFFSVYVGAEKQRFLIKTEFANHPLFKMLLEDAELEYGFKNEGPLTLPCEIDLFCKVLAEMDGGDQEFDDQYLCGSGSCSPFMTPTRRLGGGFSAYVLLTPPRLCKYQKEDVKYERGGEMHASFMKGLNDGYQTKDEALHQVYQMSHENITFRARIRQLAAEISLVLSYD